MSISNYPNGFKNGITIRGVPITVTNPGETFWVNNSGVLAKGGIGGSDGNDGSYQKPFATIDYAVGRCTAGRGDTIMVMPGHAETVSAAGDIVLDVEGISVIGLGSGTNRPTITFDTAATADIDINAENITVANIIFSANFADIAAAIDVNASAFTMQNCHFKATAILKNFKICIQPAAVNWMELVENTALLLDAADTHWVNLSAGGDGHIISGNLLHGNWGTAAIGGAGAVTRCTITDNRIFNIATDADSCINMAATATGIMSGNHSAGGHATAGHVPGDLGSIENYYVLSTSDLSGVLDPAIV